ncbi:MAG TPA: glycosyltransferase family 39 protein [Chitinophagales bacterium]|nr:glycosyltransferase family 39 protein [Chitinophagales bacterium]
MNFLKNNFFSALLIIGVGSLILLPFLGAVHLFDWDEINFAESAREMIATGNYARVQIDYQPFWEKPPLFFWLQAASMHAFGINEFAARFPDALIGIITLLTFFFIGKKLFDARFGMLWALSMIGSFLPLLYFKSGIIDPVFNYFIFAGIYFMILLAETRNGKNILNRNLSVEQERNPIPMHRDRISEQSGKSSSDLIISSTGGTQLKYALLSGIFIGLATLTKGPVALLIVLLTFVVYWIIVRFKKIVSWKHLFLFIITFTFIAGIWVLIEVMDNGFGFFRQFFSYQIALFTNPVAGHSGPVYYHFVVVFLGCFPMSVIAMPALTRNYREETPFDFKRWMLILFWVVMILFTIVKTKIAHYSSLTYFPLSFLCALVIHKNFTSQSLPQWVLIILVLMGSIFSLLLFGVPWLAQNKEFLIPRLKDPFAIDCLSTNVHWNGTEQYIGAAFFLFMMIAVVLLWKRILQRGIFLLFGATALCLLIYLKTVLPKIESYSQGPAIEFYQTLEGQHVYVNTIGFKSYAQYFYFRKQPSDDSLGGNQKWLLKGAIDRPAYFVVKSTSMSMMLQYPDVQLLKQEGGFAFYVRKPQ